jgi:hypothetical protein
MVKKERHPQQSRLWCAAGHTSSTGMPANVDVKNGQFTTNNGFTNWPAAYDTPSRRVKCSAITLYPGPNPKSTVPNFKW